MILGKVMMTLRSNVNIACKSIATLFYALLAQFSRQRFSPWKGFDPVKGEDEAMGLAVELARKAIP